MIPADDPDRGDVRRDLAEAEPAYRAGRSRIGHRLGAPIVTASGGGTGRFRDAHESVI